MAVSGRRWFFPVHLWSALTVGLCCFFGRCEQLHRFLALGAAGKSSPGPALRVRRAGLTFNFPRKPAASIEIFSMERAAAHENARVVFFSTPIPGRFCAGLRMRKARRV